MTNDNDPEVTEPTVDEPLKQPGLEALRKEREAREAAEKRLAELERAQKEREEAELTEAQRLGRQVEELTAAQQKAKDDADAASLNLLRYQIATEKGIPANWVARLQGADRESLEADADALLPSLRLDVNPTPKADPSQGARHDTGKKSTADTFADQLGDF